MSRKRWRRLLVTVFGILFFTVLFFVALVIAEWPALRELQSWMSTLQKPIRAPASEELEESRSFATQATQNGRSALDLSTPTPLPRGTRFSAAQTDVMASYLINRYVSSSGGIDVRVCANLGGISSTGAITNPSSLLDALMEVASGSTTEDPYVESVLAPVGTLLQRPDIRSLIQELSVAPDTSLSEIVNTIDLYSQLALATADFFSNKSAIERTSQHAYHLYVLSRAIQLRPEMLSDPDTLVLCSQIEDAIVQLEPTDTDPNDMNSEKAAILRFLATAGITPEQVGYDPNLDATISFSATADRISLKIPWMQKAFGGWPDIPLRPSTSGSAP